jgi:proteasome lid subunit RPN8/RPN11
MPQERMSKTTQTMVPLIIDAKVDGEIRRHGEETYPHECCGALVGAGNRVTATVALPNTTEEGPRRRFMVRPSDYRVAEQKAGELGGELLGFYHSHPDHPARPSQYDLDHAWPTFAYIIVAVASGKSQDMTVWYLKEDRSAFDEGELNGN